MNDNKRKELFRDNQKGKIAGICAGVANYFGWEIWLIRIAFTTGLILNFPLFIVIYIAAWLILSKKPLVNHVNKNADSMYRHASHTHTHTHTHTQQSEKEYVKSSYYSNSTENNEHVKVKARVWQAGDPPKKALKEIYKKFTVLETRLNSMEKHVTSSNFDLSREIDKL